jgi:hypothetical protein
MCAHAKDAVGLSGQRGLEAAPGGSQPHSRSCTATRAAGRDRPSNHPRPVASRHLWRHPKRSLSDVDPSGSDQRGASPDGPRPGAPRRSSRPATRLPVASPPGCSRQSVTGRRDCCCLSSEETRVWGRAFPAFWACVEGGGSFAPRLTRVQGTVRELSRSLPRPGPLSERDLLDLFAASQ